ncbi:MAG TPA: GrpB family protein, partial [Gemmatimonadaceae bacterium]|nr:GrpB family protein [Gemmatimonadaceae bacterium]
MANPAPRDLDSPLGLESGVVRLVPYNPTWLRLFIVERSRIEAAVGRAGIDLKLEHTGSTSIPGVCAKPILDILAGASDSKTLQRAIDALQTAEYQYRGEQGIRGRHFFRRG